VVGAHRELTPVLGCIVSSPLWWVHCELTSAVGLVGCQWKQISSTESSSLPSPSIQACFFCFLVSSFGDDQGGVFTSLVFPVKPLGSRLFLGRIPGHQTIGNLSQEAQSELRGISQGQIRPCTVPVRASYWGPGSYPHQSVRPDGPATAPTGRGELDYQNMLCCCSLCKRVGIVDNRPTRLLRLMFTQI
jgi:hypothetical protein